MKNIIKISSTILFALVFTLSYSQESNKDLFTVKVDGLGCPFCAYGLEKKFKEFEGIDDVKIEMETGIFTFSYPTIDALTLDQVENQVDAAGYTAVTTDVIRANGEIESLAASTTEITGDSEMIEASIFVSGNCGMCQARIEKNAKRVDGVVDASWDKDTNLLTVSYDATKTSEDGIAESVAASGHDTKDFKADGATYDNLPGCCQYERKDN